MNKEKFLGVFFHWLPLGGAIVLVCGLIFVGVQQNYRADLNNPQVQIAEDVTAGLSEGKSLGQFSQQIDIEKSLTAYIIIYDGKGEPIVSSGLLEEKIPKPPFGVLEHALAKGENRIIWEPKPGVRSAIVVRPFQNGPETGFVLVGRNMREVEDAIAMLVKTVACGMLVTLAVSFGLDVAGDVWRRKAMAAAKSPQVTQASEDEAKESA